jgi:TonB-linked SusC/RagA family outer membrane protein
MEADTELLDELVVVGYGTMRKSDLTGGISTVSGDAITNRKNSQVSLALQGAASGVMVNRSSGDPGTTASIRIRGVTSIGNSNPLIIVDGVPMDNIDQINPNDIESISVMKDAASSSIYGSRAAAGVILVNTKRSKDGELSFNYDFNFGIETPTVRPDVVNVIRYMEMSNELAWNDQGNISEEHPVYPKDLIDNYIQLNTENKDKYPITDWENLIMKKNAPLHRHNLTISGGSKNVKVNGSLSYEKVEGLYSHRYFERLNSRINTDVTIVENFLDAKMDFFFLRNIQERPITSPGRLGYMTAPIYPAKWEDGRVAGGKNGDNPYGQLVYGGTGIHHGNLIGGKLEVNLMPIKGLNLKALVSPSLNFDLSKSFTKKVAYYDAEDPLLFLGYLTGKTRTNLYESRNHNQNYTIQLIANYENQFEKHTINSMAGYEEYSSFTENLDASRENFEFTYYPYLSLGPLDLRDNSGNAFANSYRSVFSRIMYNYNNKYLLQGNIRGDASSRFHPNHRWGYFPSLSAGWIVSSEPFWKSTEAFSYLKLRASYGTLGNERIGNYPYQSTLSFTPGILFFDGPNIISSTSAAQIKWAIPNITWEKTESYNIGIDAYFVNNKLSLTGDLYSKRTTNMLLALEIPSFIGFNNPDQNAGLMQIQGWDVEIGWRDKIGDINYSVSANLFDSRTYIKNLSGTAFIGDQITAEGTEFQEWYGYKTNGLFQTQEEVDNLPKVSSSVKPGDVKFIDVSGPEGVPDGMISPDYDRIPLGGSLPRYQFGSNINIEYKNFDFGMVIQGVGRQLIPINNEIMPLRTRGWYTVPEIYDENYWSYYNTDEDNINAKYPRLSDIGNDQNYTMSDFWLINGAYLRIKNLNVGYSLSSSFLQKIYIKNIRLYCNISDLYSFDNFIKGYDTEARSSSYPITTTILFGVNLMF